MTARLPRYRLLTGTDDAAFCLKVSAALDIGYDLHEGPAIAHDGQQVVVAQAVIWRKDEPTPTPTPTPTPIEG